MTDQTVSRLSKIRDFFEPHTKKGIFVLALIYSLLLSLSALSSGQQKVTDLTLGINDNILTTIPNVLIGFVVNLLGSSNLAFIFGFGALIFVPFFSFIFWLLIFYFLFKVSLKSANKKLIFIVHILVVILIFSSYYQRFFIHGKLRTLTNEFQACLVGSAQVFSSESCLDTVIMNQRIKNNDSVTAQYLMNECTKLSDTPVVFSNDEKELRGPDDSKIIASQKLFCMDRVFSMLLDYNCSDECRGTRFDFDYNFPGDIFRIPSNAGELRDNTNKEPILGYVKPKFCSELNKMLGKDSYDYCNEYMFGGLHYLEPKNDTLDKVSSTDSEKTEVELDQIRVCYKGATDSKSTLTQMEARAKADEIYKIATPSNYIDLWQKFSKEQYSDGSGKLGYYKISQLSKPFGDALFKSKVGDILKPIEVSSCYYIIWKVNERLSEK